MAVTKSPRGRWWPRFHLLSRLAGATGLAIALVGLALVTLDAVLTTEVLRWNWDRLQGMLQGQEISTERRVALLLLVGGLVAGLFALLLEILVAVRVVAGRRGVFGLNVVVQLALAGLLFVGVNVYSALHYERFDLTWGNKFTLPTEPMNVPAELAKLQHQTTIVVYQRQQTFSKLNEKQDGYDSAAARKVVEKVKDLVEEFREFGPQFKVVTLDVGDTDGYQKQITDATKDLAREDLQRENKFVSGMDADNPEEGGADEAQRQRFRDKVKEFRDLIEGAPENSIFFFADGKTQRLSFNEFYRFDKTASRETGNLVLLNQGVGPFARKVLNIDGKKPRVGVLVIHEWLTSKGPDEYGLRGLKTTLEAQGMDVRDIVLKKWGRTGRDAAVYTYDESKYERLGDILAALERNIKTLEDEIKRIKKIQERWQKASLKELTKEYAKELRGREVTEAMRSGQLEEIRDAVLILEANLAPMREKRDASLNEQKGLNVDRLTEQRRLTDLKAKLDRELADCDLIVLPRMTLINLAEGRLIPNEVYSLDKAQVAAVKDYMKKGKPVLACFGPTNERSEGRMPKKDEADELEQLLGQLGVVFGKQTVLYDAEIESFAETQSGLQVATAEVVLPPVEFEWTPKALGTIWETPEADSGGKNNRIREAMKILARSRGKGLDLQVRHPRPIGFDKNRRGELTFEPEFMVTSPATWNDDNPFPSDERTPRYEPKLNDPNRGTFEARRRGPFPIGVAFETKIPADWYSEKDTKPATARVAVIGSGGVFVGSDLKPAQEQLLLTTCNWLLGRDELLPNAAKPWHYPRVEMTEGSTILWKVFAWLGLPALFAFLGVAVMLVRWVR